MNASVKNNTITGAAVCVSFIEFSSFIDVTGNSVYDAVFMGIMSYSVRNAVICNNSVHDCGYEGIHLDGGWNGCRIAGNTVREGRVGISLERPETGGNLIEDNILLDNNASIGLYGPAKNVFRRNNMTSNQLIFLMLGYELDNFMQDIDDSNLANGKKLYYLTNCSNITIDASSHPDLGYLALINCTEAIIRDLDFSVSKDGLVLAYSTNCTVANVTLWGNHPSLIWGGLMMFGSTNNAIINSKIGNNSYGACLYHSDANMLCHNCFVGNDVSVVPDFSSPFDNKSSGYVSQNIWDNGLEGNFWSNYNGTDLDNDGVGDTHLPWEGVDNFPLMNVYWNPYDINHDLEVNRTDISISADAFGTRSGDSLWNPHADISGPEQLVSDGKVDMRDISLIARHFGEYAQPEHPLAP